MEYARNRLDKEGTVNPLTHSAWWEVSTTEPVACCATGHCFHCANRDSRDRQKKQEIRDYFLGASAFLPCVKKNPDPRDFLLRPIQIQPIFFRHKLDLRARRRSRKIFRIDSYPWDFSDLWSWKRLEADPRRSEVPMAGLATFNFKLSHLYPGTGEHHINTCGNPDCSNFGQPMTVRATRKAEWQKKRPDFTTAQLKQAEDHGPGAYKLSGADKKHRRVSNVFAYASNPHLWSDQRTIRCLGQTSEGQVCNSGFSILSPEHLGDEIDRLRNHNGVLDGPACGAHAAGPSSVD